MQFEDHRNILTFPPLNDFFNFNFHPFDDVF